MKPSGDSSRLEVPSLSRFSIKISAQKSSVTSHFLSKISSNFKWRNNGHIQRFFRDNIESEFFDSRFGLPQEKLIVLNGMLSSESNAILQRKFERLSREFDEMANEDRSLPLGDRMGYTAVLAVRNWRFSVFEHLQRKGIG